MFTSRAEISGFFPLSFHFNFRSVSNLLEPRLMCLLHLSAKRIGTFSRNFSRTPLVKKINTSCGSKIKRLTRQFLWINPTPFEINSSSFQFTVISIKTLENHLKSTHRVRRVKWRHLSSDRVSVYRYSIPAITYEKSKLACDCVVRRKKLWLLGTWLSFILFLCIIVVLGSLNPEDRTHPYLHYNSTSTQLTLQTLRNISIG